MPKFIYQVRNSSGAMDSGILTAADMAEASHILRDEGHAIVDIHEESSGAPIGESVRRKRIKRDDIIFFTTQLAIMVDTGVPLTEALDSIAEQSDHPSLKVVLGDLAEQVKSGVEFSTALENHPKLFNDLFVALMRASEASGTMGEMLQRASEYMAREREIRKMVKGAVTYPICMLSFCIMVVVGLLVFVLPRFEKIYSDKGATLPMPTRFLLGLSSMIINHWLIIVAGLVAAVVGAVLFARSPGGRVMIDKAKISMPGFGQMYRKACLAKSLRTMATMITTGVSLLDGLAITAKAAGNHFYHQLWTDIAESVKQGSMFSDELFKCRLVPGTFAQMISAGEQAGRLGEVMNRVAGFCEDDLSSSIKTLTSLIEPAMTVVMGVIVGGIAMALLLPVFRIATIVAH